MTKSGSNVYRTDFFFSISHY
uniref:RpoC1 n=1 Tax=Arundo donax TaxID=35708 RepID=A0A0A9HAH3_ARUDO